MAYDYDIEYVKGEEIPHVDALSRLKFIDNKNDTEEDNILNESIHWTEGCGITWKELMQETMSDRFCRGIRKRISTDNWRNCSPAEMQFKKVIRALTVENEVIIIGSRPMVPQSLRNKVIQAAHRTHAGMSSTKLLLKQNVWWPGMDRDVESYIRAYKICATKPKAMVESQRHSWERPSKPFERIYMD